jgi:hypothetical protein
VYARSIADAVIQAALPEIRRWLVPDA